MIINGKDLQEQHKQRIANDIQLLGISPRLAIIQVGDNPASNKYVNQKVLHGSDVGIDVRVYKLHEDITTDQLISEVDKMQRYVDALIVQLPLPRHINEREVLDSIDPWKDVDCLTTTNQGLLYMGTPRFEPCTPYGITLLKDDDYWKGKDVLIIGRSHIVGKPLATMLTQKNATVTVAHSHTAELDNKLWYGRYDVIVAAVGRAKYFAARADLLIDVGINFDENGKMCGDFDLDKCTFREATPVPNGVGRMTIIGLLDNVVKAATTNALLW